MSKHTDGPWRVYQETPTGSNDWSGKAVVVGPEIRYVDRTPAFTVEDAQLIAAAPEMLAMLKETEKTCRFESEKADGNGWHRAAIKLNEQADRIATLIARAEGEGCK